MASDSVDMPDLEQPVTRGELRAELRELRLDLHAEFATKAELRIELAAMKTELCAELRGELASKAALDAAMKSLRDELRTHFDVVAESLRDDIRNMFDWMKANISGVTTRFDALETGHGTRLMVLETRVTKLEAGQN
jgi:uncharacterized coiled-coil DUF342 family protein